MNGLPVLGLDKCYYLKRVFFAVRYTVGMLLKSQPVTGFHLHFISIFDYFSKKNRGFRKKIL